MSWIQLSLLASLLFAMTSLTDKLFIDRILKNTSAISIVILSALAGLPFLFGLIVFSENLPDLRTLAYGFTAGWLVLAGTHFYFTSLRNADAAVIMGIFQLVLPFSYIFGLIFFNEQLSVLQITGALIVVGGSLAVSMEEQASGWRIKKNAVILMTLASLFISFSDVVFKLGAQESEFLPLAIAEYTGTIVAGLIVYYMSPKVHQELNYIFKKHRKKIISITQLNEAFYLSATLFFRYALLVGPIALVSAMVGTSPIFVLILGWLLGILVPKFRQKKSRPKDVIIKLLAMSTSCVGIILMSL